MKVFDESHLDGFIRAVADCVPAVLHWRQLRTYLLAEEFAVISSEAESPFCSVAIRGYLRGGPAVPSDFIHVTGEGSHSVEWLRLLGDPCGLKGAEEGAEEVRVSPRELVEAESTGEVRAAQWPVPREWVGEECGWYVDGDA